MLYTAANLLVRPSPTPGDPDLVLEVTPDRAGWEYISFQVRHLATGRRWSSATREDELALVNLSGRYAVASNRGYWTGVGARRGFSMERRMSVSAARTEFTVTAEEGGEFAVATVPTDQDHAPFLTTPGQVSAPSVVATT
jgi:5-deoxy-glucuronate isomerase